MKTKSWREYQEQLSRKPSSWRDALPFVLALVAAGCALLVSYWRAP